MTDVLSHLNTELNSWAAKAQSQGWLSSHATRALERTTTVTPGTLFNKPNRPLVVGFFGGTGVGKSTLLNRFAGEKIAKASVERPTSRDITVYLHHSVTIDQLPTDFPMSRMRTAEHQNNQYRSIMWIDMPDFDSVEASHRELVDQWLPHIDVVVYVVSPERYRDDHGWRLLLEHGQKHAWLFVINHWDRGDERQRDDFSSLLMDAGLADPHLFCTDSSSQGTAEPDDFETFRELINSLADDQLVDQLESRGVVQRIKKIKQVTDILRKQMGNSAVLNSFTQKWPNHWSETADELVQSVDWKIASVAASYAEHESGMISKMLPKWIPGSSDDTQPQAITSPKADVESITDDVFFDRIKESVDEFLQAAPAEKLPTQALQRHLQPLELKMRERIPALINAEVSKSLITPGTELQRKIYQALGTLGWALPMLAMLWVAFRVVNVFRLSAENSATYLSGNFAIHSILLVAIAWAIPTFLRHKLKPSRELAATQGLRLGIDQAIDFANEKVAERLHAAAQEHQQITSQLEDILDSGVTFDDSQLPKALQRMLMSEPAAAKNA